MSVLPDSVGMKLNTLASVKKFLDTMKWFFWAGFVTTGEDRTLKIWNIDKSDAAQTIALPAQSGWNVAVLKVESDNMIP